MPTKIFIIAMCLMLSATAVLSEEITLKWDIPDESDIDGFRCFQRTAYEDDAYDYSNPINTSAYPDGNIPSDIDTLNVNVLGEENGILKYMWVCRSYKGDDESENSNEVAYKVVNTEPPTPTNLTGSYDDTQKIIKLSWDQPVDKHPIYKWIIYYKLEGDTDFTELGMVDYDHELTLESPFDVVAPGEKKKIYFTVVSFRRSGIYSPNSTVFQIEIDRSVDPDPPKPQNLHLDIDIPVT